MYEKKKKKKGRYCGTLSYMYHMLANSGPKRSI
ncbi:hypothetical protein EYF80_062656 [Liparis tanakae]|uniref:Uncharacterized protein n=1 Tax=Liparis tanakae TaxID=230148 RepID=A0A4Z2EES9_9TELE|nr:hypothetical protein EYF80_062656 [Liparis tanakae]